MPARLAVSTLIAVGFALTAVACGGAQPESETADASHEEHAAGQPRVFFEAPLNGATVQSPVQFVFGSELVTIAAVPPGEITTTREGMVHFHLGVDTDCLPAGTVIPKADPWIHFGDGKNVIEMQLSPGPHKFAVQAGDDLHATVAGLCETIEVTVTE